MKCFDDFLDWFNYRVDIFWYFFLVGFVVFKIVCLVGGFVWWIEYYCDMGGLFFLKNIY